jgi:hypothetical protein
LLQDVFDFIGAEGRIDGDQHDAGEAGAEFQHHPFGRLCAQTAIRSPA